jgi:hypothetical protein
MARGLDLLVIFLGLETFSLCFYILAAYFKRSEASSEAGLKYFLTGAFASSFTLFGIAFVFGATGTIAIDCFAAPGARYPLLAAGSSSCWPDSVSDRAGPFIRRSTLRRNADARRRLSSVAPKGAALVVLFRCSPSSTGFFRIVIASSPRRRSRW